MEAEVEHDAVELLLPELLQRFLARADRGDLHVAIADQLDQRVALHFVVFDDQQRAQLAVAELANRVERLVQRLSSPTAWPRTSWRRAACRDADRRSPR